MNSTLPIFVRPEVHTDSDTKALFTPDATAVLENVPLDKLRANLQSLTESLNGLFRDLKQVGAMRLAEVTVQVEVSASGGVNLIGTMTVGGKGAISLKFTG